MEKISPCIDVAFKKLFGVDENKDLLISLINSIVSPEDQVSQITLLNPYNLKNFRTDTISILDIKAENEQGKRFNIEIQVSNAGNYEKRALFYWAKLYSEQLSVERSYKTLCKTIGIHILNFNLLPDTPRYHNVFIVKEKDIDIRHFKDFEIHTVELKKFSQNAREDLSVIATKVKTALDAWVTFLTRYDLMDKDYLPKNLNKPELKKALDVLQIMNFGTEERDLYESHVKWLRMEADALQERLEEGIGRGRAEGEVAGQKKEKKEIALRMLKEGLSTEQVARLTGLSHEELREIIT